MRMQTPDGKIGHAEIQIGDSVIFLADESPNMGMTKSPQTLGGCTGGVMLYVDDVDTTFKQAVDAGGKSFMPVADNVRAIVTAASSIPLATRGASARTKRMYRQQRWRNGHRSSTLNKRSRRKLPDCCVWRALRLEMLHSSPKLSPEEQLTC